MSNFPQDPYVTPQVVEKRGMSSGTKVLLILGILFLLCVLLCCGGGIVVSFMASKYAKDAVSLDPAVIAQRRSEILDIEIPEPFTPQTSMDMTVPMTDQRLMMIISYTGQSPADTITLVGIGELMAGQPEQQMRQQIEQSLQQQGIGRQDSTGQWEAKEKEFTIAGKPTTFVFRIAKDENNEPKRFDASGMVTGKRGPVLITISADAETLSEEQIDKIIESIK